MTCPCECEACIVFYPVVARSSREVRNRVLRIRIWSFKYCSRSWREFQMNIYIFPFHLILRSNGTAGCPTPKRLWPPRSDSARPGTPVLLHIRARAGTCPSTCPRVRPAPRPQTSGRPFPRPPRQPRAPTPWSSPTRWQEPVPRPTRRTSSPSPPSPCCGPSPVRMEAGPPRTEAGKGGVRGDDVGDRRGDAGWGAGAAPQNVLPLRHHLPQPRGGVGRRGRGLLPSTHTASPQPPPPFRSPHLPLLPRLGLEFAGLRPQ